MEAAADLSPVIPSPEGVPNADAESRTVSEEFCEGEWFKLIRGKMSDQMGHRLREFILKTRGSLGREFTQPQMHWFAVLVKETSLGGWKYGRKNGLDIKS